MPVVFLVDDDASIRRSLTRMLRGEGFDVHAFESAKDFLARPDPGLRGCVVLDVSMPGLDGLELQARLAAMGASPPIVFLSGHGDIPMSVRAIKRSASDFLTKPVSGEQLVEAIREALARDELAHLEGAETAELKRRLDALTPREREVLGALVEGKLNKQIADELGIVEQTVKFHRAHVMEGMQARTLAELIHMAARLGVGLNSARRPRP